MGILEFIQVLVAIILGLGMAEVLRGFADLLRPGAREVSRIHLALAAWLFLQLVQFWWAGWRFASVRAWRFHELLMYLAGTTVLYLAARLAFPDSSETRDLRGYYAEVSARLWMLVSSFFACAVIVNVWLIDTPPLSAGPVSQLALCLMAAFVARTRSPAVQVVAIVLLFCQMLWRALSLGVHT